MLTLLSDGGKDISESLPRDDHPEYNATAILIRRIHDHLMILRVRSDGDVVFAATGTGEDSHNAMICELLSRQNSVARLRAV